jgi:hypothetical protein
VATLEFNVNNCANDLNNLSRTHTRFLMISKSLQT